MAKRENKTVILEGFHSAPDGEGLDVHYLAEVIGKNGQILFVSETYVRKVDAVKVAKQLPFKIVDKTTKK